MIRVLILIDDVCYEFDNRMRREVGTLQDAGASVSVISMKVKGQPTYSVKNGAHVYQYWKPSVGSGGAVSHFLEYAVALPSQTLLAAFIAFRHGFDVVHFVNPPDLLWLVAAPYKLLRKRLVYDQHDICPELFDLRFGDRLPLLSRIMRWMERASHAVADHTITTTESFRRIAMARGGRRDDQVTVVRNGPRLSVDFPPVDPDPDIRALGRIVVGYLGIMNDQDHIDLFIEMARIIRKDHGRADIAFVLIGTGDAFESLKALRDSLGLTDAIRMLGRIPWSQVLAVLEACDICVQPDAPNCFNDNMAMNKLMEYMAMGKAAVAFDMPETRISGGDTVVYVPGDAPAGLADAVIALSDDDDRRRMLGEKARRRIEEHLCWERQRENLLSVYDGLFPGRFNYQAAETRVSPQERESSVCVGP